MTVLPVHRVSPWSAMDVLPRLGRRSSAEFCVVGICIRRAMEHGSPHIALALGLMECHDKPSPSACCDQFGVCDLSS